MDQDKPAAKKPKPRSIAPPNEDPFSNKNKGRPITKTAAKAVAKRATAVKKTPVAKKTSAKAATPKKSPPAPKKEPTGKLKDPKKKGAEIANESWEAQKSWNQTRTGLSTPKGSTKGGEGGKVEAGNGVEKRPRGRPPKQPKKSTVWDAIKDQVATSSGGVKLQMLMGKTLPKESVLVRPTNNAEYEFKWLHQRKSREQVAREEESSTKEANNSESSRIFRIQDLPKEVRTRIWRHAVVLRHGFIWPEEQRWRHQPDLALTCRTIRSEVLPLYYAENTFAINLHHAVVKPRDKGTVGISVLETWGPALEGTATKPRLFESIRSWAFMYAPPHPKPSAVVQAVLAADFVVAVSFAPRRNGGCGWDANVEVHREARCVLPGYEEFGLCKVKTVPGWLNDPVIAVTEIAEGGKISSKMVFDLAEQVQKDVIWVQELRCEEIKKSIEMEVVTTVAADEPV